MSEKQICNSFIYNKQKYNKQNHSASQEKKSTLVKKSHI